MAEQLNFLDMFRDYEPQGEALRLMAQTQILSVELDQASRHIEMSMFAAEYIPQRYIKEAVSAVCSLYYLNTLELTLRHPSDQLQRIEPEELRDLFVAENSMTRGSLAGAKWQWQGSILTVLLKGNGKKALEECAGKIARELSERFETEVEIRIEAGNALEGKALFEAMERLRSEMIVDAPAAASASQKEAPAPVVTEAVFGKPFKGTVTPMKEINLNMGNVIVEGKVFAVEHKDLPKRNAVVIKFDMTDNTSSIRISRFLEKREAEPILQNVNVGSIVRVLGRLMVDNYTNETVLKPNAIMSGSMPKRKDTAAGEKRVELHLHTVMSNMDALTNTKAAIKQAAAWGHKAIAITDHGCVQSFTDALHVVEDWKGAPKVAGTDETIKILYGCEGYYINDVDDRVAVQGGTNMSFDDEYVAFDLETTGLYRHDTIIEIGAVRMKNGEEIERFQTFVDPKRRLHPKVVELTGITDDMLKGAPTIEEILPQFREFVGDSVLVAHNADFDANFIRRACERQGIQWDMTFVDTLTIAQCLMPELGKFRLDIVAKKFDLADFNHHRAGDDALVCGRIAGRLFQMLKERGVADIQSINEAMLPLRPAHRQDTVRCEHIVLFAKNQVGLRNLYRLISESNLKYYKKFPRIFKSELLKYREGLIIGSACENNELFQAVLSGKSNEELQRIASFYDYLEVQPISNNRFMLAPKKVDKDGREVEPPIAQNEEQLRQFNREIVALGEQIGKLVVATGDVHFLNPEDEIFRHILLSTKGFADADKDNPLYFRSTDEMLEEFAYLGAEKAQEIVVKNPNLIADMCETLRPVPHNLFAPSIENSVEDLKNLVYGKLHRLYGENPPELFVKRVETELNDIINCHYDVIYMSAQKLVQNSLENGYLVGSRGSVGSSIVAYMSGITEVNSFPPHYRCPNPDCKHTILDVPKGFNCGADLPDADCPKCGTKLEKDGFNIPFETFLGFGGDKVPDIDLNFSGEYQARAHAYCTEMFGKSHVFRAGTIGTVAEKTAFGYVKKYMEGKGQTVPAPEMNRLASGCVGVRRTTGQHPGGLVVIPQENEIWDFCPVQHPADDPNSDQITTHFEYHSMEENLLKLDMLGHDDPTMIRMMEDMTGVDAKTIP